MSLLKGMRGSQERSHCLCAPPAPGTDVEHADTHTRVGVCVPVRHEASNAHRGPVREPRPPLSRRRALEWRPERLSPLPTSGLAVGSRLTPGWAEGHPVMTVKMKRPAKPERTSRAGPAPAHVHCPHPQCRRPRSLGTCGGGRGCRSPQHPRGFFPHAASWAQGAVSTVTRPRRRLREPPAAHPWSRAHEPLQGPRGGPGPGCFSFSEQRRLAPCGFAENQLRALCFTL